MVLELNNETFATEVTGSDTPVFVDFWAPWCAPCKMMVPVFEEVSKKFEGKVKFAKVNTQEFRELAMQHNVSGIPCLILFKNGKETGRIVGFKSAEDLESELNSLL